MELELGLAPPNHTSHDHMMFEEFDLNCSRNSNGIEMEKSKLHNFLEDRHVEVEGNDNGLSLLLWNGQPNDENDGSREKWRNGNNENNDEANSDEIVGWPPIHSSRIDLLHRHQGGGRRVHNHRMAGRGPATRNSTYVKVKMEGVAIGRKIDLSLYNSYQGLRNTLLDMFVKYNRIDRTKADNTILYQDKEGDWMLVGDVSWETFVESVQRIEILRSDK